MKRYLLILASFAMVFSVQSQMQMNLVGQIKFRDTLNLFGEVGNSEVWGWTAPDGEDYAIMGTLYGMHFVRVSDMSVRDSVEGPIEADGYYHREMKTYRNYCYVASECTGTNEGVMIIDMKYLPDSVHFVKSYIDSTRIRSHNLSIDTANAMAYINDHFYDGVRIVSLADPENPVDVGFITAANTHDEFARNDTVWLAEGWNPAYSIWDCSNPAAPLKIGGITDVNFGYAHNIWPTDDGKYFLTTEETSGKTVKIWDMSNISNIQKLGEYIGSNGLAHNVLIIGDSAYIAHYTTGVTVVDISDKANPVEVAFYDTYPQNDTSAFYGCWGAFPFTSTGYIYGSNFDGLLTVMEMVPDTSVGRNPGKPLQFIAGFPWPNPAASELTVPFKMMEPGFCRISVIDVIGREVKILTDEFRSAGACSLKWNTTCHPAGIYTLMYRMGNSSFARTVLVR